MIFHPVWVKLLEYIHDSCLLDTLADSIKEDQKLSKPIPENLAHIIKKCFYKEKTNKKKNKNSGGKICGLKTQVRFQL